MKRKYYYLLIVFLSLFILSNPAFAQEGIDKSTSDKPIQTESTIKLKVTGLTCSGDLKDIQEKVTELKGVKSCRPARKPSATTVFEVKYDAALVSEIEIRKAVESTPGCSDPDERPYKVKM